MRRDTNRKASTGPAAIVAARSEQRPVETGEIRKLTDAAGYAVVRECTQVRPADSGTYLGAGKVDELASTIEETDAELVVVDGELTPKQTTTMQERLPRRVRVFDRFRLILEIFSERARHRRAQLQVELATLRYDLPRIREAADEGMLNRRTEKGSPVYDVRNRIDRLERKLDDLPSPAEEFRKRRRAEGFDLVTVAGYTNAGKSTLLHRLADDLSVTDAAPAHPDETGVAPVDDRLFETLETTTRRATIGDRPTLVTDTVGFVRDLPHWLVRSFSETLSEAGTADVVILVGDASDPIDDVREKRDLSLSVLDAQSVDRDATVVALNKIDRCSSDAVERRRRLLTEHVGAVVPVSATDGVDLRRLEDAVLDRLPTRSETLVAPNGDAAMRLVSWLYDHATVTEITYAADSVTVSISGRPPTVEKAKARARAIREDDQARNH